MAKSMRSKRIKRLRAIRREIVAPLNEGKEAAKLAAQEAALAAPKLPVRVSKSAAAAAAAAMEVIANTPTPNADMGMPLFLFLDGPFECFVQFLTLFFCLLY